MKVVKFLGGLGNQMFQYAFYLSLEQQYKKVKADVSSFETYELHNGFELEQIFDIKLDNASSFEVTLYTSDNKEWIWRKLRRLYNTKNAYYQEKIEFGYDSSIYSDKHNRYYWGYWQHIDYITPIQSSLRKHFAFPKLLDLENQNLENVINASNSISVHIRRGDYLGHPLLGGICDKQYYERAIKLMTERIESPLFVFFSNDIGWCREHFQHINSVFVDKNQGKDSFIDMKLMQLCKHNIIANSSFSWWGAWLNEYPEKIVISPRKWVNDPSVDTSGIILQEFIKL